MDATALYVVLPLLAVVAAIAYAYVPLRKKLYILLHPRWRSMARLYTFPEVDEVAAERDLLIAATVLRDACDVIWHEHVSAPPEALFGDLPRGTVVHVNTRHLPRFIDDVLPRLRGPIVLVTGYETVTTRVPGYERVIDSPMVLHWFLQNFELDEALAAGRVTKIPVGLNFHKLETFPADNTSMEMGLSSRHGNQQLTLLAIRDAIPPLAARPPRVYANFQLSMDTFLRDPEARKRERARREALEALRGNPDVDFQRFLLPRNEVWRRHRDYAFEISPHGNGLDCHRTWEALLLKCIPIVKTSSLDSLYDGLPVVIVADWREVDAANLARWRAHYRDAFAGPVDPRLFSGWWIERFRAWREPSA